MLTDFQKDIHRAATQYQVRTGAWPCSMEELQLQQVSSLAGLKKWQLVVNCNKRLAAVIYNSKNGKKDYRAIYFDSGRIEAGNLNE